MQLYKDDHYTETTDCRDFTKGVILDKLFLKLDSGLYVSLCRTSTLKVTDDYDRIHKQLYIDIGVHPFLTTMSLYIHRYKDGTTLINLPYPDQARPRSFRSKN